MVGLEPRTSTEVNLSHSHTMSSYSLTMPISRQRFIEHKMHLNLEHYETIMSLICRTYLPYEDYANRSEIHRREFMPLETCHRGNLCAVVSICLNIGRLAWKLIECLQCNT